jgi:hypothetical protein
MKKILLIIGLFLVAITRVNALDIDYVIDGFYVDATVKENGDMLVKEAIVQDGSFNGYSREIDISSSNEMYNASGIELIKVCEANGSDFGALSSISTCFEEVSIGSLGDSLVYEKTPYGNGFALKMFNYTEYGYKTYYIEYLLKDVVILHNDIAE